MALTAKVCIVSPEQGPVWDMEPGRPTTFKLLSDQTSGSMSVFEELVPVGAGTPLHIHRTSDETIHLLAGELKIKLGTQVTTIGAGTWVFIPQTPLTGGKTVAKSPSERPLCSAQLMARGSSRSCAYWPGRFRASTRRRWRRCANAMATNLFRLIGSSRALNSSDPTRRCA